MGHQSFIDPWVGIAGGRLLQNAVELMLSHPFRCESVKRMGHPALQHVPRPPLEPCARDRYPCVVEIQAGGRAVSYTHLDVYKRQATSW